MKLLKKEILKDGSGYMVFMPDDGTEDLWHTYNLIAKGDHVRATTIRKVAKPTASGTTESERVRITLTLVVVAIDFDPQGGVLRIKGRNVAENEYVKLGAYHTLELELNRQFSIQKKTWDAIALERVQEATDQNSKADVAAIVMSEGLAHLCLISGSMTITRQRIEMSIPRKRGAAAAGHEKAMTKFFEALLRAILQHVNFEIVKCVLVASPGFVKDQFMQFLHEEAQRKGIRELIENKSKFVMCHASSGHKHALREVLSDPAVSSRLSDTKAAGEVRALNSFHEMLSEDPDRAFYGYNHVQKACERGAIQTLLLADSLFRANDMATRTRYVALAEAVAAGGGEIFHFSTMHVSGEQLQQLSGVAAILRFPLPDIADEEVDEPEPFDDEPAWDDEDDGGEVWEDTARSKLEEDYSSMLSASTTPSRTSTAASSSVPAAPAPATPAASSPSPSAASSSTKAATPAKAGPAAPAAAAKGAKGGAAGGAKGGAAAAAKGKAAPAKKPVYDEDYDDYDDDDYYDDY
eukprot:tig00020825_g14295.t1